MRRIWKGVVLLLAAGALALLLRPAAGPEGRADPGREDLAGLADLAGPEAADLGRTGAQLRADRAEAALLAAAPDNPLHLEASEADRVQALVMDLEVSTARASWALYRVGRILDPRGRRTATPEEVLSLPPSVFLEEAPEVIAELRTRARVANLPLPDDHTIEGLPDSSGHNPTPVEALLMARKALGSRRLDPAAALGAAVQLELCRRALEESERQWAELLAVLEQDPSRRRTMHQASGRWRALGARATENDIASHAAILYELPTPDPGRQTLPLGHPADHLANCQLCRETLGDRADAWLRSLGRRPEDFRSSEALLEVHRSLLGSDRLSVFHHFGPPVEDGGDRWTYRIGGSAVVYRFDAADRAAAVTVEPSWN